MSATTGKGDRFYVPKEQHPEYQRLTQPSSRRSDADPAPFREMKEVFILSAVLGYRFERRERTPDGQAKKRQHIGFWHYLDPVREAAVLESIAIAETGDVDVLGDRPRVIAIAEEYAAGGFPFVLQAAENDPEETLERIARDLLRLAGGLDLE